ncbi:MAG: phosphoribosylanthranilate isomerase [Bacteroidota bacterium]
MNTIPKVKICCIASLEEAQMAIEAGASAIGLVGPMPSGPGVISNERIAEIAAQIPSDIDTFLLTSETKVHKIVEHYKLVKTTTIQLVDALEDRNYKALRIALPNVKIVQVIHVLDATAIQEAQEIAPQVDAILLDSGNPNLAVKTLGGTGKTHNWAISQQIVAQINQAVYLAGGLKPENVGTAIRSVRAYGLDLCSGVRNNGKLDASKLANFMAQVRETYRSIKD